MKPTLALRIPLAVLLSLAALALALATAATVAVEATAQVASPQQSEEDPEEEWEDPGDDEWLEDEEDLDDEEYLDEEVMALEEATAALGRAKRAAAGKLAKLSHSSSALRPCLSSGPGWKRIRAIVHRPQRALYAASARRLLADMKRLLDTQQPRIVAYQSAYERFVASIRAVPVSDPILAAAIAAQARRIVAYRHIGAIKADCKLFNKLTRRVREFPTRSAAQIVRADYRAAPIARAIERHVSGQLAKIDRRSGITHRDAEALADAAELMVELGGDPGYATGFQYALSLR